MIEIICTEFSKYKRTFISWAILGSAFLTALLGVFMASDSGNTGWNASMAYGIGWLNMLSLMLIAVLTGMVFAGEYMQSTARILFTYPIARWKFYAAKLAVLFCWTILLYAAYFFFAIAAGMAFGAPAPDAQVLSKALILIFTMTLCNFTLVPITALVSILVRGFGSFILAGAAYVAIYFSFIRSGIKILLPMTIPNVIKDSFLASVTLTTADWTTMMIALCIIFALTTAAGVACYAKRDA